MRTNNFYFIVAAALATGCMAEATTGGNRGVTMAQHAGTVSMVFTNATPEKMCNLQMSFDGEGKHGDNWLPAEGLDSGKSVAFKVKPGKYKATWNTCRTASDKAYYAATLCNEWAFEVKDSTQLFAYVADTVAPTKRAGLKELHALVKFPGQQITPGVVAKRAPADAQVAEHHNPNEKVSPKSTETEGGFDAADFVDSPAKAKKSTKPAKKAAIKPTLGRSVDVGNQKVKYAAR